MNSELAKQLRDAGFPIKPYPQWGIKMDGPMGEVEYRERYVPTLSELIEACGDDFDGLFQSKGRQNSWRATASRYEDSGAGNSWQTPFYLTPEEAVAKLWLSLHPKA
jgi:hypothetical protein